MGWGGRREWEGSEVESRSNTLTASARTTAMKYDAEGRMMNGAGAFLARIESGRSQRV